MTPTRDIHREPENAVTWFGGGPKGATCSGEGRKTDKEKRVGNKGKRVEN